MPGTLYVVSTPIGNLADLSDRARATLAEVDVVACEDTRTTAKLLKHFNIHAKTVAYHEHNEAAQALRLLARLEAGDDVALVSDAGTPLVSDPGFRLVRAAREADVQVVPVPGPSALLAALSVSGLPASPFTFFGFAPARGAARRRAIAGATGTAHTFVMYEAPGRIASLLDTLAEACPERPACLSREMTKLHEEHRSDSLAGLSAWARERRFKGELTLVVGPAPERPGLPLESLGETFEALRRDGLSAREAAKRLAREHGLKARDIYQRYGT